MDTPVRPVDDLRFRRLTLRIVTPPAIKRTSLEEYGRADAWTIVSRVPNYVENSPSSLERCQLTVSQLRKAQVPLQQLVLGESELNPLSAIFTTRWLSQIVPSSIQLRLKNHKTSHLQHARAIAVRAQSDHESGVLDADGAMA
jgi:hypothetical protein